MVRRCAALLVVAGLLASPAPGFDTYWQYQATQKVGEQFAFSDHAWKIMQLGNFSADFFGPIAELASKSNKLDVFGGLDQSQAGNPQVRGAAVFLHFDNLSGDLASNSNFDYLFAHLLQSTQT